MESGEVIMGRVVFEPGDLRQGLDPSLQPRPSLLVAIWFSAFLTLGLLLRGAVGAPTPGSPAALYQLAAQDVTRIRELLRAHVRPAQTKPSTWRLTVISVVVIVAIVVVSKLLGLR